MQTLVWGPVVHQEARRAVRNDWGGARTRLQLWAFCIIISFMKACTDYI